MRQAGDSTAEERNNSDGQDVYDTSSITASTDFTRQPAAANASRIGTVQLTVGGCVPVITAASGSILNIYYDVYPLLGIDIANDTLKNKRKLANDVGDRGGKNWRSHSDSR